MKDIREQIIEILESDYNIDNIENVGDIADAILALVEQKATDHDIENAAADYINEPEQAWNTADYLHIADAYERGAKDLRDNNIYISPK